MRQKPKISNGVKKLFILISLSLLLIPLTIWAQFDNSWMLDNLLNEDETVEPEINLISLELYWSADSYVPFGYAGKPLPTKGSWVTVNADLKVSGTNPKSLKYSWFLDGIFQESKSGYGKDSFQFGVRRLDGASHLILLKLFNESRSFYVEKSISVPVVNPDIVVYHKNNAPLNLSYLSSEKSFDVISNKEVAFLALPYFFNIKSIKDLEFQWTLGDKSAKDSSLVANIFGLKIINKEVGGFVEDVLKVLVSNKLQSNQRVQKTIPINVY